MPAKPVLRPGGRLLFVLVVAKLSVQNSPCFWYGRSYCEAPSSVRQCGVEVQVQRRGGGDSRQREEQNQKRIPRCGHCMIEAEGRTPAGRALLAFETVLGKWLGRFWEVEILIRCHPTVRP